jgi:hypothetical protein
MAEYGDLRGPLEKMIQLLKSIDRRLLCQICGSELAPLAATEAADDPATIAAGFTQLNVTKTNGSGTVTITFPDASTYVLSADGEVFQITGSPTLGEFIITGAGGATFKYYAY